MKPLFNIDPSITASFSIEELKADDPDFLLPPDFKATVIGGGSGIPVSIKTLLSLGAKTSAVVAMADDGGSTGRLREIADATPPGDIRKCICAFASDPTSPLTRAFKYRIPEANNHTLGNLIISALEDSSGSFYEAIKICEKLLNCKGHVYPSTLDHITLSAKTCDSKIIDGQAIACSSETALDKVIIKTDSGATPNAFEPAKQAIKDSNLIVIGPGSLFTSLIPNLLVQGIVDTIKESKAPVLFVCSIEDAQGETWGLSAYEHLSALNRHGMQGLINYMLINDSRNERPLVDDSSHSEMRSVLINDEDIDKIQQSGTVALLRDLSLKGKPGWHNPKRLREAFISVIKLMGV